MFCRKCGNSIPSDSEFCPVCGYTTVAAPEAVQHQFQPPSFDLPFEAAPNPETNKKPAKSPSSKKKKKIIAAVVAAVLAVALIVTGCIVIPDLIFNYKTEKRSEILNELKSAYHAGDFEQARALAAALPFNDSDRYPHQQEIINRIIDFGEELSAWEGTSYELLDKIEAFIQDITDMEYSDAYLYITYLNCPEGENLFYYLQTFIPALRKELDAMSELTAIMEDYGDTYYKNVYEIYNLYCKSSFRRDEATKIDSALVSARKTALDALKELQSRYPDFAIISECFTLVEKDYSNYTEYLKPYLFDVTYQNGYVNISESQGKTARDKIPKFIQINAGSYFLQSGLSASFGYMHTGVYFPSAYDDNEKNNLDLSLTDYTIFRIAYLLNGNREIKFAEGGFYEDISDIINNFDTKYAP